MSDGLALLKAIVAEPLEDTPRLVYADWLEENGESARAEFIRIQVQLDADPRFDADWVDGYCSVCGEEESASSHYHCGICGQLCGMTGCGRTSCEKRRSERELLYGRSQKLLSDWSGNANGDQFYEWFGAVVGWFGRDNVDLRRGFVDEIRCTTETWLKHADDVYWQPNKTEECKCRGMWIPQDICTQCGSEVEWKDTWVQGNLRQSPACPNHGWRSPAGVRDVRNCPSCDGIGRVPRPFPRSAQPITRIELTSIPLLDANNTRAKIRGRQTWHNIDNLTLSHEEENGRFLLAALEAEWPGVEFSFDLVSHSRSGS